MGEKFLKLGSVILSIALFRGDLCMPSLKKKNVQKKKKHADKVGK